MAVVFGANNESIVGLQYMRIWAIQILLFLALLLSNHASYAYGLPILAYQVSSTEVVSQQLTEKPSPSPLIQLGNEYHNSITLLQNRFRIDYEVEEITMIFFREFGSSPIVLVRPDGSKIFQQHADEEKIFWYDTSTYDMISIKNPELGPWQAVGDIMENSRVMVISDLALHAEKLPDMIFSGEILKQTAYLTNDGKPIDYKAFRDVVELVVSFSSTNNPNYDNFGAGTESVATFQDNGQGMDEKPLDGIFTGQFNLSLAGGEWIPNYKVFTPMYSREQVDPNIILLPNPIKIEVDIDDGKGGYHTLKVDAVRDHVDISTLLLDGKVRYPNGEIHNFSITDMSSDVREHLLVHFGFGVYRIKLTAFANTLEGREFILDVPEFSFLVEQPEPVVPAVGNGVEVNAAVEGSDKQMDENLDNPNMQLVTEIEEQESMSNSTLMFWIIGVNLFLVIVGGGVIYWLTSDKKLSLPFFNKSSSGPVLDKEGGDPVSTVKKPNFFANLFKKKSKQPESPDVDDKKETKDSSEDDAGFMDLSIPKD